jgi:catechol 2,3-dioxygenase-like lactoylglutathione lyase family enzyme
VGRPYDQRPAGNGNGWMVAFAAPSRAAVDAAHAAAMAAGGTDEGASGPRPHFAPDYYGAYVRDPDGNKLHFVRRGE